MWLVPVLLCFFVIVNTPIAVTYFDSDICPHNLSKADPYSLSLYLQLKLGLPV